MRTFLKNLLPEVTRALRDLRDLPLPAKREWMRAFFRRRLGKDLTDLPVDLGVDPRLLFVCRGNIYRSPVAAALFAREAARRGATFGDISSAGLAVEESGPSPEPALRVAAEQGIPIESHRSRHLTDALIAEADVIVLMDRNNESLLAARAPAALQKTILLGAFDPVLGASDPVIADPYGHGHAAISACFAHIERSVPALLDTIIGSLPAHRRGTPRPLGVRAKALVRTVLTAPPVVSVWADGRRDAASILMLHRFTSPDRGVVGHDADHLATNLEYLRRNRFHICSLQDLVDRLDRGEPPLPNTVVFTVDDGYVDFAEIGAPVFARFDVPATTFLVTRFVDGHDWVWYDVLRYCVQQHQRLMVDVPVGDQSLHLEWRNATERRQAVRRLIARLHAEPTTVTEAVVRDFPRLLDVEVPPLPTSRFAPMTWEDVRALEAKGMRFGPHTHTHPILSRTPAERLREEVDRSWTRLRSETAMPTSVFCFPSGMPPDYSAREMDCVRDIGLRASVVASGGRLDLDRFRKRRFALPRLPYEESPSLFRWRVAGAHPRASDSAR